METVQEVTLHYSMLEYLFKNRSLTASTSSYVWESFKTEYPEFLQISSGKKVNQTINQFFQQNIITDDLKSIFLRDVLDNIDGFGLLTDEMKEYFDRGNIYAGNDIYSDILKSIDHNEPKGGGKDFKLRKSAEQDDSDSDKEPVTLLEVSEAFKKNKTYEGAFGYDTDSDLDDNCIEIAPEQQPQVEIADEFLNGLVEAFGAVLKPAGSGKMSLDQIAKYLANPDVFKDANDLKNLPIGIQQFMDQMFASPTQNTAYADESGQDQENYDVSQMLEVPTSSSSSGSVLTDTSNRPALGRVLRSSSSSLFSIKSRAITSTPMNKPRSKKNLVPNPAANARMEDFTMKFASAKRRRRSSNSPEPKS